MHFLHDCSILNYSTSKQKKFILKKKICFFSFEYEIDQKISIA